MVKGIGTDILAIKRIRSIVENNANDAFIKKTFTKAEIDLAATRHDPVMLFATRFAGKEAIFKALHITEDIRLNEIEILEADAGRPYVVLHGKIKDMAEKKGISFVEISLSYETDYAVAFAVAI